MDEPAPRFRAWAALVCAALLTLFATTAWLAVRTKSPGYDEPYHALSSWLQLRYGDFRFDNEDPPLWQYWAALPNGRSALTADFNDPMWQSMPHDVVQQWRWGVQTLYRTPGNDPNRLIDRCRLMMLSLAVLLGILICCWTWRIGGATAAVMATGLFCLDPNFLAHGVLMKNDVVFAMSMFALTMALWRGGRQLRGREIAWIALLCVVTLTVKFSGIFAVLLVPLLLGTRALMPGAWEVLGRAVTSRWRRLLVAGGVTLLAALISWGGIWAVYLFRYRPTPQPDVFLNLTQLTDRIRENALQAAYRGSPPPGAQPSARLPLAAEFAVFADLHRLLPQPFVAGFLFTYANGIVRSEYLCGQLSLTGWWWYFPFAMLVKTAIMIQVAAGIAVVAIVRWYRRGRWRDNQFRWSAICLAVPPILFLALAMASNLNIGIRHVLAVYPYAYVVIGCALAALWRSNGIRLRAAVVALFVLLSIETFWAFPSYLAFFNAVAANVPGGKLELLGDSNLDWGQDLPLLVQWQQAHPKEKLYLSYFGFEDPRFYGLRYTSLPGGYLYEVHPGFASEGRQFWWNPYEPCVIAISATNLQGILVDPSLLPTYEKFRQRKPIAVLGDTIYLYRYDPAEPF